MAIDIEGAGQARFRAATMAEVLAALERSENEIETGNYEVVAESNQA